jgi:DnaJ-class molecular chaperone
MANFNEIEEARKLLGLGEAATLDEIKRAYRTLAHRHHPDKHGGLVVPR